MTISHQIIAAALVLLAGCNLEVGNPDNDIPAGRTQTFQKLEFSLASRQACETTKANCTSIPVLLSDSEAHYTFEMTSARLQLGSALVAPYAEEKIITQFDILAGATVALAQPMDAAQVKSIAFTFSGTAPGTYTFVLTGNIVTISEGKRIVAPLTLVYGEAVTASAKVSAATTSISGVAFDANAWFDLRGSNGNIDEILKNLVSGPCRDSSVQSCNQFKTVLAARIAHAMSKSLSVKTEGVAQKLRRQ